MRIERIMDIFKQYDQKTQELVRVVLSIEQEHISYDLKAHTKQVQGIKQNIKQVIDRMYKKNED